MSNPSDYDYARQRERLLKIGGAIAEFVSEKDRQYGSSWRQRGGVGAFFTIVRKLDRLERACEDKNYDIFKCFAEEERKEGILDDCVDIIGYLLVLLEYMIEIEYVETLCDRDIGEILDQLSNKEKSVPLADHSVFLTDKTGMEHPFGYDEKEDGVKP